MLICGNDTRAFAYYFTVVVHVAEVLHVVQFQILHCLRVVVHYIQVSFQRISFVLYFNVHIYEIIYPKILPVGTFDL